MRKPPGFRLTLDVNLNLEGIAGITDLLQDIADSLRALAQRRPAHLTGGQIVFIVKDTQPDVAYSISGVSASDAEGNAIPDAKLTYGVASTDEAVVAVTPDPTDPTKGTAHFGNPGVATINVAVSGPDGTLLGSFAAPFTVTTGDPSAISGGSIIFDGLTEAPPPTP